MLTTRGRVVLFSSLVGVFSGLAVATETAQKLSTEQMLEIHGGTTVNNFPIPQANTVSETDDVGYYAELEHVFVNTPDLVVEVRAGTGKIGYQFVSTTLPPGVTDKRVGNLKMHAPWPLAAPAMTAGLSFCNPTNNQCGVQPLGNFQNANVTIRSDLRVTKVIFHNLLASDGSEATSMPEATARSFVDNLNGIYDPAVTPGTDPILSRCANGTRWNMRFHQMVVTTVPKSYLRLNATAFNAALTPLADAIDPGRQYFHVFFFKQLFGANGSEAGGLGGSRTNFVGLADRFNARWTAQALVHEFGHTQRLAHVDDPQYVSGGAWYKSWPSLADCSAQDSPNRNIMCTAVISPQTSQLLQVQCDHMLSNPAPVRNFN